MPIGVNRLEMPVNPYPHEGGCPECTALGLCNHCGKPTGPYPCTNGRCGACHGSVCTPGGATELGHGYGVSGSLHRRDVSEQLLSSEEDAGQRAARLDTILRTYTPRELKVAREAIAQHPESMIQAIKFVKDKFQTHLRAAKDLVDAVAEADGAYEHARSSSKDGTAHGLAEAARVMQEASTFTAEELAQAAGRIGKAGVSVSSLRGGAFDLPIVQEGMRMREEGPARRVLGRGLAEIEQAREQDGAVPLPTVPAAFGTVGRTAAGEWTGFEGVPSSPLDADMEQLSASILRRSRGDSPFASKPPRPVPVPVLSASRSREAYATTAASSLLSLPLQQATQRAVDEFLGTGTHRTAALRGFLRFLTQEDLATVLGECCERIDGEHLEHVMRMLGPDDLQAVNFASAGEVSVRMIDAEVPQDFPVRPLTAEEHAEPVDFSENGNPILEKDIVQAMGYIEAYPHSTPDEAALAARLERLEGWNGVYAGEVAREAWARYYREREEEQEQVQVQVQVQVQEQVQVQVQVQEQVQVQVQVQVQEQVKEEEAGK